MRLGLELKHYFYNAFRELFVHHHGSLEFRARIFALLLSSYDTIYDEYYDKLREITLKIYENDEDRANLLVLLTSEFVQKIKNATISQDELIATINKEIRVAPRFAKKIDIEPLKTLAFLSHDRDTNDYQNRILEFLESLKDEMLHTNKDKIEKDELEAKKA